MRQKIIYFNQLFAKLIIADVNLQILSLQNSLVLIATAILFSRISSDLIRLVVGLRNGFNGFFVLDFLTKTFCKH